MERAQEPVGDPTGAAPLPALRRVTVRRIARQNPGGKLLVAGLVVPALLAAGGGYLAGPSAEDSLVTEASAALRAEGLKGVRLKADGPFVTAYVPTRVDPAAVGSAVNGVPGVSDVITEEVYSSKQEARACTDLRRKLDRATGKQRIPFVGESAQLTAQGRRMVVAAAGLVAACGSAEVYVGGHTDPSTPDGSTLTLQRAKTMMALMRRSGTPEERMTVRGYGAQYPVTEGDSRADRLRNQRGSVTLVEG